MPKNHAITGLFGAPAPHPAFPTVKELLAIARALPLPIHVEDYEKKFYYVVHDDELVGGTKLRIFLPLMEASSAKSFAYASPAYGYAQIALAQAAVLSGKTAHIFVAQRSVLHERTKYAERLGAHIHQVPHGYLSVCQARMREFCQSRDGCLPIPFGGHFPGAIDLISLAARRVKHVPKEVWCVAASGTLSAGLQMAWPNAQHCVVKVGAERDIKGLAKKVREYRAPEKFERDAEFPPPFDSCSNYDAKVWRFFKEHASPGALYWNVGA